MYTAHFSKRPEGFPEGPLIEVLANPQDEDEPFVYGGKFHTEPKFVQIMRTQEQAVKHAPANGFRRELSKLELMREALNYFRDAVGRPLV